MRFLWSPSVRSRSWRIALVSVLALSAVTAARSGPPDASEQIIFSGVGLLNASQTPFGFWVWCESESSNPYVGNCYGAVYVYSQQLVKKVEGTVTEFPGEIYTMNLSSSDRLLAVTLTNVPPINRGPHNTVNALFSAPPVGAGSSSDAVVNATGP